MAHGAAPFGTTPLGAPSRAPAHLASGFQPTLFGVPLAIPDQLGAATGTTPGTTFGLANVYPGYVPSLGLTTLFGTPDGPQIWRASALGPVTRISTAYYAFAQTLSTTGRNTVVFGTPLGSGDEASGGTSSQAFGFVTAVFGTPIAGRRQDAAAAGANTTAFGTPTYTRGGARVASGFSRTRLGKPRSRQRTGVRYASGTVTTELGTPSATVRNRVMSLAIVSRFGTPLLTRSTTC